MKRKLLISCMLFLILSVSYSQKKDSLKSFKTDSDNINDICYTNKGQALAIADNDNIKVFSVSSGVLLNEFHGAHNNQILAIDISNDSTLLISAGKDNTLAIWDFITGVLIKKLDFQNDIITTAKISPGKRFIALGGTDNIVYVFETGSDEFKYKFTAHSNDILSVAFSPDGNLLASAGADGLINLFDLNNGNTVATLTGHKSWVRQVLFSTNGSELFSCGDDGQILLWKIKDLSSIRKIIMTTKNSAWITSLDFNETNVTYCYGNINGRINIVTPFNSYFSNVRVPVNKIIFKPDDSGFITVALATQGKGVLMMEAIDMKSISKKSE